MAEALIGRVPSEKDPNRKIVVDMGQFDASEARRRCVAEFLVGGARFPGGGLAQKELVQRATIVVDALSLPLAPEAVPPH